MPFSKIHLQDYLYLRNKRITISNCITHPSNTVIPHCDRYQYEALKKEIQRTSSHTNDQKNNPEIKVSSQITFN